MEQTFQLLVKMPVIAAVFDHGIRTMAFFCKRPLC
jgi:hypothetical protein